MSRIIKFRAWDNVEMKMYYTGEEDSIHFYFDSYGIVAERFEDVEAPTPEGDKFISSESEKLEHLVYMQYTGLKDKNGIGIYEGDVLTSEFYPFQDDGEPNYHGVIEWIDELASFYMTKRLANSEKRGISDGISEQIERIEEFEVIGNIYENPELLEVNN